MILDERLEFCDATALHTNGTTTVQTGDIIDLGAAPTLQNLNGGADTPIYFVITIDTAVVGTSSTVQFKLVSDATDTIHATTMTEHFATALIPEATLVAGYLVCAVALPFGQTYERYLAVQALVGTANLSAGKINAFLTMNPGKWVSLPNATNA